MDLRDNGLFSHRRNANQDLVQQIPKRQLLSAEAQIFLKFPTMVKMDSRNLWRTVEGRICK